MTLEWKGQKPNSIPPTAVPIADADVLIEKPEDLETPVFSLTLPTAPGKLFALARWTLAKTAYWDAARKVFTARAMELSKVGLLGGVWSLFTKSKTVNNNIISAPVLNLTGRNDEATIAAIKTLISG